MEELLGLVRAMRSLAAARVQQGQAGLESIHEYAAITVGAIHDMLAILPERPDPSAHPERASALFVLTSEHGFVGALNARLLNSAAETQRRDGAALMIVGSRGAAIAAERAIDAAWTLPMASHSAGVEPIARKIADEAYRCYGRSHAGRIDLLYPRAGGTVHGHMDRLTLLPFAPREPRPQGSAMPPLSNEPTEPLFTAIVQEHVFAVITRAVMETLVSVNRARLFTMQSAYDNLEDKARELRMRERRARQEEITTELLDVVTGAEALG